MVFDCDLFVIGGGSGGVRAARIASGEHGAKVILAEDDRMGGTCVIRGCVPKKLMVFASGYAAQIADARAFGWDASPGAFDWTAFRTRLHAELDRLEQAYRKTLAAAGVEVRDRRATLADAHTVLLSDGSRVTARHILVATGGRPFLPDVPGRELALTSDDMFHLPRLPQRLLIVGGGYIASEFACIFNGFGVGVTQWFRASQVLRGFDGEARGHIAGAMRARGIDLRADTAVRSLERHGEGIRATPAHGPAQDFDAVLYATGRLPNTLGLGLEAAGIALGRHGEVPVDRFSQTRVPSVFAVGDVTNRVALTPVAIREAHAFADTVFGARPTPFDHAGIASAVFTQPELGTIGMTEEAARAAEPIEVYATDFRPMQGAFAGREERALMKLVVSQATRRVLGCHIIGPGAGEMIQLVAVAIGMGATKEDFDRTVAVHPTMAEELVTLRKPLRRG